MPLAGFDLQRLTAGDRRMIARAITLVENSETSSTALDDAVFLRAGNGYRIGITGPPGAGKSTIAGKLALHLRREGHTVGIIAVDPTSPFTGGALLGDRVRMTDVERDEGVFIRSMASRGSLGGLSTRAVEAADILDAAGMEFILLETVGVGQSELDVARAADTTMVVLVPESGDAIQAMKAGLMEIADFFVVNKADRAGADQAAHAIETTLGFRRETGGWRPPVIRSVASEGRGIEEIARAVAHHRSYLQASGALAAGRRRRLDQRLRSLVSELLHEEFWTAPRLAALEAMLAEVWDGKRGPASAAREIVGQAMREP